MNRLLVFGDRNWTDEVLVRRLLFNLPHLTLIHGAARGADTIAGRVAAEFGWRVHAYPADWNRYGRAAGPIRNQQMLDEGKPEAAICFHDDLSASKGSRDMAQRCLLAHLPIWLVRHEGHGIEPLRPELVA